MSYASQEQFVLMFGERETIALTDRNRSNVIDVEVLSAALLRASNEVDSYLAGRYQLPLQNVPGTLVDITCDIARYKLTGGSVVCSDEIIDKYKMAVKFLEKASRGVVTLGVAAEGAVESDNSVMFASTPSVFVRDKGFF